MSVLKVGKKVKLLVAIVLGVCLSAHGQDVQTPVRVMESFEEGIPAGLESTGGRISIDTLRMKYGEKSLKWDWSGNAVLTFDTPIGYQKQRLVTDLSKLSNGHGGSEKNPVLAPPRGFFLWIYNDKASNQRIRFQFGRGDEVDCEFDYNLNFKGWRTVVVGYDRGDMRGVPREDMTRLTINAPATGSGTFYLDVMGLSVPMNPRTVNPNPQLPEIDMHPRLVSQYPHLLYEYSKYRPTFPLEPLTDEVVADFRTLEAQALEFWLPAYEQQKWNEQKIAGIRKRFEAFEITRSGDQIYGRPLVKSHIMTDHFNEMDMSNKELLEGVMIWKTKFDALMGDLAKAYRWTNSETSKKELESMFIDLFDYGIDQGFDTGAGLGWMHHYSYCIRAYAPAMFLMKEVLLKHDKLNKAIEICKWFYSFNQVYNEAYVYGFEGRTGINADESQGLLSQRLTTALLMEDSPEKARDLKHFSSYFSNITTAYAHALDETFKPDGTVFHHAGHAYGYGGRAVFGTVATLYMLSSTSFSATQPAYDRMSNVVETLYLGLFGTEKREAPKAFASIRFSIYELNEQFYIIPALMALASPARDEVMESEYLELIGKEKPYKPEFQYWLDKIERRNKITSDFQYVGFKMLPYSNVGIRRQQNDWMITVRGHSKYVIPFESWGSSFFAYPLYIAHGYLDIAYPSSLDSSTPSDGTTWVPGFDWHRWPGSTTVRLPYDQMETNPGQVRDEGGEYLLSDQAFSGGVSSTTGLGLYAFQFKGHDKFGLESFTGKKSYFFFGEYVVCIGSDITSGLTAHDVETTLFQTALVDTSLPTATSEGSLSDFPIEKQMIGNQSFWAIDSRGSGYFLSGEMMKKGIQFYRNTQTNPDAIGKKELSGDFVSAYINHGSAPDQASYQYIVMADATPAKMETFATEMNEKTPPFSVLQSDENAHVVHWAKGQSTAYAVYAPSGLGFKKGTVKAVNKSSTFITESEGNLLRLSVADPDLNIYEGQDDRLPDGSRVELSIYEHEWFFWPSRPHTVRLTLRGSWAIAEQTKWIETAEIKEVKVLSTNRSETVIEFECRDGLSAEVLLTPKK
ncbi:chondroitinase family polysaccharide lyase [Reichenbachiella carrageenanivorans]|uniref:Chondroitinase family polysaccharide lyase n=1 Tax=Reichenbachiella carrageenanivorans TaxID=2979869 RepID=A0ABY6D5G4_9BACT|nr:chondroitinase family polysaccharide lyase [Reichenbachiella carrageenanivorans]UXX79070.1 chondroitinase family polysaccharide lyase [Reichenbachiella carrageenanivorans]